MDLGLVSKISKFADDTKMGIDADSDAAVKQLQEDLRKVGEWSKKWQMPFNLDKCKIMHIGHKNKNEKYELLGKEIESVQSAGYQSGLHKSRDVRECQPGITTGESRMFQALVVPDRYPAVPSVSR